MYSSASKYGNLDLVRLLVSANANLRFQQADGSTALMRACYFNHYDLAAYLIERHVEIEACNVRRETALYIAAFRGHTRLVEMLVNAHGARVNSQDLDGDTPLSVACYENRPETIRALLAHGARVDVHGIRGDTPLHVAVCNCSAEVVEWLCLRGANADAVNNNNETPLHLAAQDSNVIIVKTLLNRARSLDQCTRFENKTVFRLLVEQADVFKIKMAMCVVKAGCDVNMSFNTENACNFSSSSSNITILSNHNHRNIWHDSPFDYLFKMPRVNFKKEDNIEQVDDKDSIYLLINFIELVLRAGFKLSPSDYEHFKASWLHEYLKEQDPVGLRNLDSLFTMCSTRPARLLDMCKFKIRQRLVKPLFPSIDKLNIPLDLKEFLFLER
jgi:ankyrin repeat protein